MEGRATRAVLVLWVVGVLLFLFVPIATIVVFAFDKIEHPELANPGTRPSTGSPSPGTTRRCASALVAVVEGGAARRRCWRLCSGRLAAFGVHRYRFFGRDAVSLVLVLPIALPGIITGLALHSSSPSTGINLSLVTIIIGHTTFCIVVVYNNVLARLRRTAGSLVEASADLGATAQQTFRLRHARPHSRRRSSRAGCSPSRSPSTR